MNSQILKTILANTKTPRVSVYGVVGDVINECHGTIVRVTETSKSLNLEATFHDKPKSYNPVNRAALLKALRKSKKPILVQVRQHKDSINLDEPVLPVTGYRTDKNTLTLLLPVYSTYSR
jgi:hypothetical protein